MRGWFVTGTDTGVGKTWVSVALMHALRVRGMRVSGMKPVASGCERTPEGLRNHDALSLLGASSGAQEYVCVNPYAFEPAIAPHIAAALSGVTVSLDRIAECAALLAEKSDALVVEGVGGWQVPLGPGIAIPDLARRLDLPMILVTGVRLGCINHALLAAESITRAGFPLAGWVANRIDPEMEMAQETIHAIECRLSAPLLGVMPFSRGGAPEAAARCLSLDALLEP